MNGYWTMDTDSKEKIYYFINSGRFLAAEGELEQAQLALLDDGMVIQEVERTGSEKDSYALNFMAARTCNMGCKYCFAGEGEYEAKLDKPKIMTTETYLKAFEWVMKVQEKNISTISFFGGEPLLGFSQFRPAVEKLEELCKKEQRPFPSIAVSTNAVLFNEEIFEFMKKYKVKTGLSVDGPRYINDLGRTGKGGKSGVKSAYECTAAMAARMKEQGMFYTIQCTLNGEHIRDYREGAVRRWIMDMGELAQCDMVFVPVTTRLEELKISDYETLKRIAIELVDFYIEELLKESSAYSSPLINGMLLGMMGRKYFQSCRGGDGFYLVDTDGAVYPCHIFCNDSAYKMGDINSGEMLNKEIEAEFLRKNRSHCEECRECVAKNICKVWCNGLQKQYNGDESIVLKERCVFQKALAEQGIKRMLSLKLEQPEQFGILVENMMAKNREYIAGKTDVGGIKTSG